MANHISVKAVARSWLKPFLLKKHQTEQSKNRQEEEKKKKEREKKKQKMKDSLRVLNT